MAFRPETAKPLNELAEILLRGPSTLTPGERELIATYVSSRNDCSYCTSAHAAFAAAQLPEGMALVDQVRAVQQGGKEVRTEDVELARKEGATDLEIHDTVLIAATFCMFNRYVDGLATT